VILAGATATTLAVAGSALSLSRANLRPGPERAAEVLRKAPGTAERSHRSPRVDGQTWALRGYDNVRGDLCLTHEVPGELVGTGCMPAAKVFARGPLLAYRGARQISRSGRKLEWDNQWIYGFAHPAIKTLTLVNINCSTQRLSVDEHRVFHHVVGREGIRSGGVPYKLHARGSRGELLAERVFAVTIPRNAVGVVQRLRAGRACS
jgi:hypothetical protein